MALSNTVACDHTSAEYYKQESRKHQCHMLQLTTKNKIQALQPNDLFSLVDDSTALL
jgi:hypothetical protein